MKKTPILFVIQLAISGAALFFVLRRLGDSMPLAAAFSEMSLFWIAACFLAASLAHAIAVLRWQMLGNALLPSSRPFFFYLRFYLIGLFYATFVPGGQVVGEGVKMMRMMPDRSSRSALIASIAADRIIGLVANGVLLTVLFLSSAYIRSSPLSKVGFFLGAVIIVGTAALGALILFFRPGDTRMRMAQPSGAWHHVALMRRSIEKAAGCFSEKKMALMMSFLGACAFHTAAGLLFFFAVRAYGFHANFLFITWVYLMVSIALVLPISYAGFGVREGVVVRLLVFAGVFAGKALLISLSLFGVQAVFALAGGISDLKEIRNGLRR